MRFTAQKSGRDEEGDEAAEICHSGIAHEVFAAQIGWQQGGEPRQPRTAGNAAGQIEAKQQDQHQGQLVVDVEKRAGQGHQGQAKDEQHARSPAGEDKSLIADAIDMVCRRDLQNDEQRHQAGNHAQHGRARAKFLRVEYHRAVLHDLE
jgi:hypothetical protein